MLLNGQNCIRQTEETIYARSEMEIVRNEYDKCYFCKTYDEYEGCEYGCENKTGFEPDHNRIITKEKEMKPQMT